MRRLKKIRRRSIKPYKIRYEGSFLLVGLNKVRTYGLGQDFSVVLDSFSISLYLGVCTSIVKHRSNSYCYSFISDVDKKIAPKMIL